jgi:hypothetical protein
MRAGTHHRPAAVGTGRRHEWRGGLVLVLAGLLALVAVMFWLPEP